ncbi:ATP-binding protein [Streptomyces sp. WMMC500]|uniref:ATP-binding protein n=1 Tax=Streptomyces sp. WMMC500 TaxID=3015154 RepID=UPI00248C7C60|nr:ATP-binding protein [Streptomyces sp. WMMC500]WBB59596.1 ATP-binding protein [Streptomyces sp. WMMC500]
MNPKPPTPFPPDVVWRLPTSRRSPARARALLAAQAREWRLPAETADTAVLLVSELLTNACLHSRAPRDRHIAARCVLGDGGLRVEVSDAGTSELPTPCEAGPGDESGRGLALVAALASRWGAYPRRYGIGKTVWFELHDPVPGPTPTT